MSGGANPSKRFWNYNKRKNTSKENEIVETKLCRFCKYLKMNYMEYQGYFFSKTPYPSIICEKDENLNLNNINNCKYWKSFKD